MKPPFIAEMHGNSFALGKAKTVPVGPLLNVIDTELELSLNSMHIVGFVRNKEVIHIQ